VFYYRQHKIGKFVPKVAQEVEDLLNGLQGKVAQEVEDSGQNSDYPGKTLNKHILHATNLFSAS